MKQKTERHRREEHGFSLPARLASFRYAFNGLMTMIIEQRNAQIHLVATIAVLALGVLTGLNSVEWILLMLAITLVWIAEALNTALEYLADAAVPETHELVGKAKDVAAAGVLIAAAFSLIVALWAFWPF
ncbi:diacylglycerol kinase family protein [uncultured Zhongshania sp.]|jgi:diacylglycerol kinase (ATP)|uniref:diacylglycerol kinase family protein n=1 Tax=uncultured Zhongshania sp. TaxID=1642288 RepID=UPI0025DB8423|nr:diacylglycerol kinase family protein [uncultured Zhongshania sp.]